SGLLYSITTTGLLVSIDPTTATATNTGTHIVTSTPIGALAANANGDLYGVTENTNNATQLYKINPTTGATLIGNTGLATQGLDFSPSGELYASFVGGRLFTINTTTGAASAPIGSAQPDNPYSSIAFDSTGTLWGTQKGTLSGRVYTIDPATAA